MFLTGNFLPKWCVPNWNTVPEGAEECYSGLRYNRSIMSEQLSIVINTGTITNRAETDKLLNIKKSKMLEHTVCWCWIIQNGTSSTAHTCMAWGFALSCSNMAASNYSMCRVSEPFSVDVVCLRKEGERRHAQPDGAALWRICWSHDTGEFHYSKHPSRVHVQYVHLHLLTHIFFTGPFKY